MILLRDNPDIPDNPDNPDNPDKILRDNPDPNTRWQGRYLCRVQRYLMLGLGLRVEG